MSDQIDVVCYDRTTGKKIIQPISKTGTYVGDGADAPGLAITGLGFSPNYVQISEEETVSGEAIEIFETTDKIIDDIAGGMANIHRPASTPPHATIEKRIISLDIDGFTVSDDGANEHPNKAGVTYNYRATI